MAIERISVPLPAGFDPAKHSKALPEAVARAHGPGWEVESLSLERGVAILTRQTDMVEVMSSKSPDAYEIKLPVWMKTSDGDKFAARQADANPGYYLIRFEPHLGRAFLGRMSPDELRCREAVANALGVKPWDVTCRQGRNKGFTLQLPGIYSPSKHDAKLQEVAESIVGRFGWWVDVNPRTLVCRIVPSEPATFPDTAPMPLERLGADRMRSPFGVKLPGPGEDATELVFLDWGANSWLLLSGIPGSGKSVTIMALLGDALASGTQVVIIDTPDKAVDFLWAKPFVRDGGWGCGGLREAVTALGLLEEEFSRRASWMAERGYKNWLDIPAAERFTPILIVLDEAEAILATEKLPPGVDKSLPELQEMILDNQLRFKLFHKLKSIVSLDRFVGGRALVSTQVMNTNTGLPPTFKNKFGHRLLQGTKPSKTQRQQALSVETNVPEVPPNLQAGGKAARGVGVAEMEASAPCVFKGLLATTDQIVAELRRRKVPTSSRPEPTEAEMDRLCPVSEDDDFDQEPLVAGERLPSGKPLSSLPPEFGPQISYGADGKRLRGAAAAQAAGKTLAQTAERSSSPPCPSCGAPIQMDGTCQCSF